MSLVFAKSSFTRAPGFTSNEGEAELEPLDALHAHGLIHLAVPVGGHRGLMLRQSQRALCAGALG